MIECTFVRRHPAALLALMGLLALPLAAQTKPAPKPQPSPAPAPAAAMSEDDKALYAVGLSIWKSLEIFDLTPAELALIQRGLAEAAAGKPAADVTIETYGPKIQALVQARQKVRADKEKARGAEFAAKAAQLPGAVKAESGLVYVELQAGTGDFAKTTDRVKVHYRGTLVDGTEFDSSHKRGQPAEFPLGGVIKCWTEGVQKMKVGGKARLVCPSDIAYGDNGRPPSIPGGATLDFEVELLEAAAPQAAPAAPPAPHPAATPVPTPKQ